MIKIDGDHLSIDDVVAVAREMEKVEIDEKALEKIEESRKKVEEVLNEGKVVYGINTGFGELSSVRISDQEIDRLQENLIRSHACGTGDELPEEVVRAMLLLRINSLAKGHSGVTAELVEKLVEGLNRGFHPVVPSQGSVGASGDLAPLAHIALAFMGEGYANYNGVKMPAMEALERADIEPVRYKAKEGLALINGTQMMAALACIALHDSFTILKNAQIAGVMSLEALNGTDQAFREEVQKARPHDGQIIAGKNLWNLTRESEVVASYNKVQDAYSLRCMPQVFGAALDNLNHIKKVVEVEINSATDNPLVFDDIISGGNFHGEPIAIAMDLLGIVMTKISSFSERRVARMLDANLSGLPPFLAKNAGLNSGLMILQYVAASLVNENKVLAYPSSVDSIPTSANKEDYQSMGATSARKARDIVSNTAKVISIEFLTASQALEFQEKGVSPATAAAHRLIRGQVAASEEDRSMHEDIEKVCGMVVSGDIVRAVEGIIGELSE